MTPEKAEGNAQRVRKAAEAQASAELCAHCLILGLAVALLLLLKGNLGASLVQQERAVRREQAASKQTAVAETNRVLLAALFPVREPLQNAPTTEQRLKEVDVSLRRVLDLQPE
jgi:hypothetical protein